MTVVSPEAAPEQRAADTPTFDGDRSVGLAEAAMLFVVAGVGLTAWVSLVLAQLRAHDLPLVALVTVVLLAAVLVVAVRHPSRPRIVFDAAEAALAAGVGLVSAVMYAPGFPYAFGDKDPGVYVAHGMAIGREGSLSYYDAIAVAAQTGDVQYTSWGLARFPAYWINPDNGAEVLPQFYHQWPALLGTAADVGGFGAVANLTPLLGVLSTVAVVLAVRRGFGRNRLGTAAGAIAGLLLATNMLQVWQAKSPSTEMLTQLYLAGATLAVVVAIRSRWAPAAALAGALTTLTFQARPDGVLLVLLAVGIGAVLYGTGHWERRLTWFAVGLALPLPTALYQAYWAAETYTRVNGIPSLGRFAAMVVVMVVVGVATRLALAGPLADRAAAAVERIPRRRAERGAGIAIVTVYGALLILAWFRESLLGEETFFARSGEFERSYAEDNLLRLSWFFTPLGLIAMWAGLCVLALRRWSAAAWAVALPGLVLLPVYLWDARISPQLIWWGRRFTPVVIVAIVALIGLALGWALTRGGRWRVASGAAALAVAGVLLSFQVGQSWRLRGHDEFGQSINVVETLSALAGDEQALYIWVGEYRGLDRPSRNLGGPLWFIENQLSVVLDEPRRPGDVPEDLIEDYAAAFPDTRVLLVGEGDDPPPGFDASRLTSLSRMVITLPVWEETLEEAPSRPRPGGILINLSVWEWQR